MTHRALLAFGPTEEYDGGMRVEEVLLQRDGYPIAPFKTSLFSVPAGAASPVDRHAVREYWVVIEGTGILVTPDGETPLSPGSAVFFDSHEPHEVRNMGPRPLRVHSTWWPVDA